MRIGRTLTPAAAMICLRDIAFGIRGWLRGNAEVSEFQSSLRAHFGVRHCVLVSSGKAALALSLLALKDVYPGKKQVVIPAFTCYSVPASILSAGLGVLLCDLAPGTLDFDFDSLTRLLERSRKSTVQENQVSEANKDDGILAVLPTHLFGVQCDVDKVNALAKAAGVAVLEDAAQAMGEYHAGRFLGTIGDVGIFSLGRGKAFSTVEGGVILTNRDDMARALAVRVARLDSYSGRAMLALVIKAVVLSIFVRPWLYWLPRSLPFLKIGETHFETDFSMCRMSPFQAGLGKNWQKRLHAMSQARRERTEQWTSVLGRSGYGVRSTSTKAPGLLRFPYRIADAAAKARLLEEGTKLGLGIGAVYPTDIGSIPGVDLGIANVPCPEAARVARELVTLPTHEYVSRQDMANVAGILSGKPSSRGHETA